MKNEQKTILMIGAGRFQTPGILKAKEMGLRVVATDGDKDAIGLQYADMAEIADVTSFEETLAVATKHRVDGVASIVLEVGVRTAADVANALGLPGIDPKVARIATDKGLMRQAFEDHKLPSPKFFIVTSIEQALDAAGELTMPIVVKPTDSSGSRGVLKVDKISEVEHAFNNALKYSPSKHVVLEEFIEGEEITVEAHSVDGKHYILAISNKKHIPFPHCVAIDLTYPPPYSDERMEQIRDVMERTLTAIGLQTGPSHSELLMTRDGPVLVEVAVRGGGYGIFPDIIQIVSGVDILRIHIESAMGKKVEIHAREPKAAVLRFFTPPPGVLQRVEGLAEARALEGVHLVEVDAKVGKKIDPIISDGTRPGMMITFGNTRAQAVEKADQVEKTVQFLVS